MSDDGSRASALGGGWLVLGEGGAELVRSAVTSAVATAIDFLVVDALVSGASVFPGLATLFGAAVGAVVNYTANRLWTFRSHAPPAGEIVRYALVSATAAILNAGGVSLLVTAHVPYRLAWLGVRAVVFVGFTFVLFRAFVFRRGRAKRPTPDAPP